MSFLLAMLPRLLAEGVTAVGDVLGYGADVLGYGVDEVGYG